MLYYSKTTRAFYDSDVHAAEQMPEDKVLISREQHESLMSLQSAGKTIVPDDRGFPAAVDLILPLGEAAAQKLERIQAEKSRVMDGGFVHEGVLFDSDTKARLAYLELATKIAQTPTYATQWKASGENWVAMDAASFAALQLTYEAHIATCFAWQAMKQAEVAAALAAEDRVALENIQVSWG